MVRQQTGEAEATSEKERNMIGFLKAMIAMLVFAIFVTQAFPDYDTNVFALGIAIILSGAVAYKE